MTKSKLKEVLVAALIGALVTFTTHILEYLVGMQTDVLANVAGGATSTAAYLKFAFRHFV